MCSSQNNDILSSHKMTLDGIICILECTVCLSAPTETPVYRCDNGHIICHVCRTRLLKDKCPVCRIELGNLRCLTSEKIISDLPINCQFQNQGCKIKLPKEPLRLHEVECVCSMVNCSDIVVTCAMKVPLLKLSHHIMTTHDAVSRYVNEEMLVGMNIQLQYDIRGQMSKIWKWNVYNNITRACRFASFGCDVVNPIYSLKYHEIVCDKSMVKCSRIIQGCPHVIPLLGVLHHLKNNHNDVLELLDGDILCRLELQNTVVDKYQWSWDWKAPKLLMFNGNAFFLKVFVLQNNVNFWVYIIESDEVAERYGSEITLKHPRFCEEEIRFKGMCVHSIFCSKDAVVKNRIHLSISFSAIDSLARCDITKRCMEACEIWYSFRVYKMSIP